MELNSEPRVSFKLSSTNVEEELRPEIKDLLYPFVISILLFFARWSIERFCFIPIGKYLGIKHSRRRQAESNNLLDDSYRKFNNWTPETVVGLARELGWPVIRVERWLRRKRIQNRATTLTKFSQTGWQLIYFTAEVLFGLYALWDKSWLWNVDKCWEYYPHQTVSSDIWWYYMVTSGYYCMSLVTQYCDVKRKDFLQMYLHHLVTLTLLYSSWMYNFHRIGSLVILVHGVGDIPMNATKMAQYADYQRLCDAFFVIFSIVWFVSRIGIYPFILLNSILFRAPVLARDISNPSYYFFASFTTIIMVLNVYWTFQIIRIINNSLKSKQMAGDVISCTDSSELDPVMDAKERLVTRV